MSSIVSFSVSQFRNLSSSALSFSSRTNLIVGPNASGKTSLIEALYHLSAGHSFRTKLLADLIMQGKDYFVIRGVLNNTDTRAIMKTRAGKIKAKINDSLLNSMALFAKDLPILLIYQDIFQVIDAGPALRRRLLDWGLFHVEQSYFSVWQSYKQSLSQRNALLKSRCSYMDALPWTEQVIRYGLQLNKLRAAYFEVLSPLFLDLISKLSDLQITIDFQNGWQGLDTEKDLTALFEKAFNRDNQYGYTQYGPHKADMVIKNNQFKVKNTLSRGQQKLILIALRIAQSQLLNRPCLYLLDDIAAEMDDENLNEILSVIVAQKNQVIMTGLDPKHRVLTNIAEKTFHVKHGVLSD